MPAASYVATPIERSLAFAKSSPSSNSLGGFQRNKFQTGDPTSNTILTTKLDFIKYEKPSVKSDIKSKYHTLSVININENISSICSTYSKSKLSLNNVSSSPAFSDLRKSLSSSKDNCSNNSKCSLPKPKEVLYSPSKITVGWQGRVPPGAGLVNAINTCYLNSCLQALFHIPSFHNWLLNDPEHQSLCEKQSGFQFECLVCAMRKTLAHCQAKSGGAIRPELIIKKLKLIARHLEHHRQEDSHEFLTYLIEGMQKSYLKAIPGANKLDSYSKETTPLYQLFGCNLRTEVACSSCSHVSTSYTNSTELSLDIRQSSSLDEALGHFFAKELLGGDNLYRCEKCGRKVEATKRFSVDKPPNVLRLQLKRFNFHGFKNSRSVLVPHHLEFGKYLYSSSSAPYTLSSQLRNPPLKYKLVSAVIHHGSSPDSGHYTCIGSTSSGVYHYFDDEMVRASNLNQLTNAYVVFYELLPSSAHHINSLHSSSPDLARTRLSLNLSSSTSTSNLTQTQAPPTTSSTTTTSCIKSRL
uniref:Ubiquitin carboxyl-terminal hydrolase 36 n=1 Tax=Cacopsylla melanoneura TaxID=428564 RepID=A0A8D8M8K9_9HEMI